MNQNQYNTILTEYFSKYVANKTILGEKVELTKFVFLNLPNALLSGLTEKSVMQDMQQYIVHKQDVSKAGLVNQDSVAYSVTMGTDVGDFSFNAIALLTDEENAAVFVKTARTDKVKNKDGIQGNSLTRNILLEFAGAAEQTQINVNAETWQIDFTARLNGIDDDIRNTILDLYGDMYFLNDGFLAIKQSQKTVKIKAGVGYVKGYRVNLKEDYTLAITAPNSAIYLDVVHQGTVTSKYENLYQITTVKIDDYVDSAGNQHYISKLCDIDSDWNVIDTRCASSVMKVHQLNAADGYKYVGRCKSIDELRNITPTEHGQRILVDSYYEGGTTGGGEFVADLNDQSSEDDGGMVILAENGIRWKRVNLNHAYDYGVVGDGMKDDTVALNNYLSSKYTLNKNITNIGALNVNGEIKLVQSYTNSKWNRTNFNFSGTKFKNKTIVSFNGVHGIDVTGLDIDTLVIDGLYQSTISKCILKKVKFGRENESDSRFKSNAWINFNECFIDQIIIDNNANWSNAIQFNNIKASGNNVLDYFFIKKSRENTQNWCFIGGDISYYKKGIYYVDQQSKDADLELYFEGIYFDTVSPAPADFSKAIISMQNCHTAQKMEHAIPYANLSRYKFYGDNRYRPMRVNPYFMCNLIRNGDLSLLTQNLDDLLFTSFEGCQLINNDGVLGIKVTTSKVKYLRAKQIHNKTTITSTWILSSNSGAKVVIGATGAKDDTTYPTIYSMFDVPAGAEKVIISMTSPVVDKDRIAGSIHMVSGEDYIVHAVSCVEGDSQLIESKQIAKIEVSGYVTINTGSVFTYDVENEYARNTHKIESCCVTNTNEINCSVYAIPKNGKVTFIIKSLTDEPLNMGYVKLQAILADYS